MESKTKEMVFSFALIIAGIYVMIEGIRIYLRAASAPYFITEFSVSPGLIPTILGAALIFFSILFLFTTLKREGHGKADVLKMQWSEFVSWVKANSKNMDIAFTIGAVIIMGIYTYVLMEILPFWAASIIFLAAIFCYLRSGKWWKNLIIAVLGVVAIVIIFQYCFNAALP